MPVQGITLATFECIEVREVVEVDNPATRIFTPKSVLSFDSIHMEWAVVFVKVDMMAIMVWMIRINEVSKFLNRYQVGSGSVVIVVGDAKVDCRFKILCISTLPVFEIKIYIQFKIFDKKELITDINSERDN
jgi:hypothetical protein